MLVHRGRRLAAVALVVIVVIAAAGCDDGSAPAPTSPPFGARPDATAQEAATTPGRAPISEASPAASTTTTTTPAGPAGDTTGTTTTTAATAATTTTTTVAAAPADELAALDPLLGEDGTLPLPAALALVAAGYRPLPGVTAAPRALDDGGPALRTVVAHLDELSDEQRRAVLAIVDLPGQSPEEAATAEGVLADASGLVTLSRRAFTDLLRTDLPDGVAITLVALPYENPDGTHNFSSPEARATAVGWTSSDDDRYDECRIRINSDATAPGELGREFLSAIAQETFHCFQFALRPNGQGVPLWAFEGAAAFAGEEFDGGDGGGSSLSTPWWTRWITQPERPLERRTFDALGFFALVDRSGADAYALAMALLSDASPDSIRRRLEDSGLFDRWGSQYANEPSWNRPDAAPVYSIAGLDLAHLDPALRTLRPPQQPLTLTVDGPRVHARGLTAGGAMSATPYRFTVPAGVLVVASGAGVHGRLRWADADGTELALDEGTAAYCLLPTACVCPNAPADQPTAQPVTVREVFIGVGPFSGDGPELSVKSLATWCAETALPAPALGTIDTCLVRDWTSTGYQASPTSGVETEVTGGDGAVLRFHDDATVTVDLDDVAPVVIETRDAAGVVTTTTLTYRGEGVGRWGAQANVVSIAEVPTESFSLHVTIDRAGVGRLADTTIRTGDLRLAAYASVLGTSRYQCTDVALTLTSATSAVGGPAGFTFS